jgi:hypothetical protein
VLRFRKIEEVSGKMEIRPPRLKPSIFLSSKLHHQSGVLKDEGFITTELKRFHSQMSERKEKLSELPKKLGVLYEVEILKSSNDPEQIADAILSLQGLRETEDIGAAIPFLERLMNCEEHGIHLMATGLLIDYHVKKGGVAAILEILNAADEHNLPIILHELSYKANEGHEIKILIQLMGPLMEKVREHIHSDFVKQAAYDFLKSCENSVNMD